MVKRLEEGSVQDIAVRLICSVFFTNKSEIKSPNDQISRLLPPKTLSAGIQGKGALAQC